MVILRDIKHVRSIIQGFHRIVTNHNYDILVVIIAEDTQLHSIIQIRSTRFLSFNKTHLISVSLS